jgi:hypothetical protein
VIWHWYLILKTGDPNGIQKQNVLVHFGFSSKIYVYTLVSKAKCTKCADWIKLYNLESKQVFRFLPYQKCIRNI